MEFSVTEAFIGTKLFSKYRKKNREDNTNDNACGDWKVETKPFLFYHNIAGQLSKERDFITKYKAYPNHDKDYAKYNQHLSNCRHYDSL